MTREPLRLSHSVDNTVGPYSPRLEFGVVALEVRLVPATTPQGPTLALCGACNVEYTVAQSYRGRVPAAVRIVAIDAQTGALFSATAVDHEQIPLWLDQPPASTATGPAPAPGPQRFEGTYFNVDLPAHLQLPPDGGDYHVFAWLDGWASAMTRGIVPPEPGRSLGRSMTRRLPAQGVRAERGVPGSGLELERRRSGSRAGLVLQIPAELRRDGPPHSIHLLLQPAQSRRFVDLEIAPHSWPEAAAQGAIAVDDQWLGLEANPTEAVHCVAVLAGVRSSPLTMFSGTTGG